MARYDGYGNVSALASGDELTAWTGAAVNNVTYANLLSLDDTIPIRFGDAQDYTIQWDTTNAVHTVASGDFIVIPTGADSATFFQVRQVDATPVFNVDTTNARVGIRRTDPAFDLEVAGGQSGTILQVSTWSTTNGNDARIHLQKSAIASVGTLAETADGENLGSVTAYGVNSSSAASTSAGIAFRQDGAATASSVPGKILFVTAPSGSGTTTRAVITADGSFGINEINPAAKLHIDQSSSSGNIPVLTLDQADTDEGFINFKGSDRGVILSSASSAKSVRVELEGTVYRLALFANA